MVKRKTLITGCKGQLGSELVSLLSRGREVIGVDIGDFDIRDYSKVESCVDKIKPGVVIHTAAYTDVDGCESDLETAMAVNAVGTENIARCLLSGRGEDDLLFDRLCF